MSAADRATSKLDLTPNISNATFRKKHNIKWLAGYAQNLDSYLTEKREDDARKKKQTGAKYGF